jgi:hypothetical protein
VSSRHIRVRLETANSGHQRAAFTGVSGQSSSTGSMASRFGFLGRTPNAFTRQRDMLVAAKPVMPWPRLPPVVSIQGYDQRFPSGGFGPQPTLMTQTAALHLHWTVHACATEARRFCQGPARTSSGRVHSSGSRLHRCRAYPGRRANGHCPDAGKNLPPCFGRNGNRGNAMYSVITGKGSGQCKGKGDTGVDNRRADGSEQDLGND